MLVFEKLELEEEMEKGKEGRNGEREGEGEKRGTQNGRREGEEDFVCNSPGYVRLYQHLYQARLPTLYQKKIVFVFYAPQLHLPG